MSAQRSLSTEPSCHKTEKDRERNRREKKGGRRRREGESTKKWNRNEEILNMLNKKKEQKHLSKTYLTRIAILVP